MRILLVEDDDIIADVVRRGLEEARFHVDVAADGRAGLSMAESGGHTLIVLDVMLPGMNGMDVCAALRRRRNTVPILMLTARDSVDDRVRGLESGADDYLAKPFEFRELLARVRALLRRDKINKSGVIRIADLEIDTVASTVRRAGQEIHLTPREYSLLEALAVNEGRVLTRDAILERVWAEDESFSNTVNVHIAFLRKKVDADFPVRLIHTVHGFGYVIRSPEESTAP